MATWRELWRTAVDGVGDEQEGRWLAQHVAGREGAEWLADLDEEAPSRCAPHLAGLVTRRRGGEPLQLVLGRWAFRHLELAVDRRALIPRPETEQVVEHALAALRRLEVADPVVVDLGTGSGAIALSMATEVPRVVVWGTDASPEALALASANVAGVGGMAAARVRLALGSWFEALPDELRGAVDLIVANPPYLAAAELAGLPREVRAFEPVEALVAGPSGYEAIEAILAEAGAWLRRPGVVALELAPWQGDRVMQLARSGGASAAEVLPDLSGRPRALVARWS